MYTTDKFIEALWKLRKELFEQPDEYAKQAKINKPYKEFFIKIYKVYTSHLKKIN